MLLYLFLQNLIRILIPYRLLESLKRLLPLGMHFKNILHLLLSSLQLNLVDTLFLHPSFLVEYFLNILKLLCVVHHFVDLGLEGHTFLMLDIDVLTRFCPLIRFLITVLSSSSFEPLQVHLLLPLRI